MRCYSALSLCLLLLLTCPATRADGWISGTVADMLGRGVYEIAVWASSSDSGYTYSASTATDGSYTIALPPGTYTVGLRDPFHFRTQIKPGVIVMDMPRSTIYATTTGDSGSVKQCKASWQGEAV